MHADRTNRTVLTLVALVLLAVGVLGLLTGQRVFGTRTSHGALIANRVGAFIGRNSVWLWPVAAVVAVVIAVLMLRWVVAVLFSTDRAGDLPLPVEQGPGHSTVEPAAVSAAVSDELSGYRGVTAARTRFVGDEAFPAMAIRATVEEATDLGGILGRIESGVIAHVRTALNRPDLPVRLDLTVTAKQSGRVR